MNQQRIDVKRLASLLKSARMSRGMSLRKAAHLAGVSSDSIRAYEHCRTVPTLESLLALAAAYAIEPGELLVGLLSERMKQAGCDRAP